MFNKNVFNIARFDFLNTLKSKGFIILNVVLCVLIVIVANIMSIIDLFKSSGIIGNSEYVLEVYDTNNSYYEALKNNYDTNIIKEVKFSDNKLQYEFDSMDENTIGINVLQDKGNIDVTVEVITRDTVSNEVYEYISSTLSNVRDTLIEDKYEIEKSDATLYKEDIEITENILSKAQNQNELTSILSTFVGYVVFMLVMTITTTVASSIANEKTSKSSEYILSTIPSKDYLNGKVLAANLKTVLTLVLVVFYILLGLVINSAFFPISVESAPEINTTQELDISFNVFEYIAITLGLIFITNTLVSYIQAYLASKIKSISELDSTIMLPTVLLAIAFFIPNIIPNTGNLLTEILSCVPVFSMYVLPTAYMLNKVSYLIIVLSFVILILTLILVYKFVSKRFKNNLLDLGKSKKEETDNENIKIKEQEKEKLQNTRFNKFITSVAFVLILSLVLGNTLGIIPYAFEGENISLVANSIVFMIYMGIPALVLNKILGNNSKELKSKDKTKVTRQQKITLYFIGLVGMILAQVINSIFVILFNIEQSSAMEQALTIPGSNFGILLYLIYLAVMPAIFEELLFRKAILSGAKKFGTAFAIIFTSVLFGLFHQNLQQILGTTLIGFILAFVTIKTGDIKTAVAIHFTNNFFALLAQIITTKFFDGNLDVVTLISISLILVIFLFILIGIIVSIVTLIKNRKIFIIKEEEKRPKFKIGNIFKNYYALVLLAIILSTIVLNATI